MRILAILLVALLLVGCSAQTAPATESATQSTTLPVVQGEDSDEAPIGQTQPAGEQEVPEVEVDFSDLVSPDGEQESEEEQRSEELGDAPEANKSEVILPEETLPQDSEESNPEVEADGYNSQIIQP